MRRARLVNAWHEDAADCYGDFTNLVGLPYIALTIPYNHDILFYSLSMGLSLPTALIHRKQNRGRNPLIAQGIHSL
jgi:hypothetical protein